MTLLYLNALELVLIHEVIAERAPLLARLAGAIVIFERQILEEARPAVDVATFCDPWNNHGGKVLHTDWTLDILSVCHVKDNLGNVFPVDILIRVI